MKFREIGLSGIRGSIIALGTWPIGGWLWGGSDEKEAERAVAAALDLGINFIDTAPAYGFGLAERIVGRVIAGRREEVVVATKCGLVWDEPTRARVVAAGDNPIRHDLSPESIRREVEASLRRMRTDYIDLYQTHWPDEKTAVEDTMECLLALQGEGKIRAIGVSNITAELLRRYLHVGRVESTQERYSMLDREIESDLLPVCQQERMAVLAYSPLAMGLLTGKVGPERVFPDGDIRAGSPRFGVESRRTIQQMMTEIEHIARGYGTTAATVVLAWTAARPGITHVLAGARKAAHVRENALAGEIILDASDMERLTEIADRYRARIPRMGW